MVCDQDWQWPKRQARDEFAPYRQNPVKAQLVLVQFHITSSKILSPDFTTQRKKLGKRKAIYISIV